MTVRNHLRFLRRGRVVELADVPPMRTVLEYLRLDEKAVGTKEGCNEGDCGACTVAVGTLRQGRVVYEPANACILLLAQLDGKELITVEDLAADGPLHPVQQAMAELHGSQCGFCTPGFVMGLFTLYHRDEPVTRERAVEHLAGNLCRCTGYRPIIDAALKACTGAAADHWSERAAETAGKLAALDDGRDVMIGGAESFTALPASADAAADLAAQHPQATIIAGATDVGLWITKQLRKLPQVIHVSRARELHDILDTADRLSLGAAVTYAEAQPHLAALAADLGAVLKRIGSKQVRTAGTVGGNIANGSPIGDMPPMLIALGATLHLRHGRNARTMPLEEFFIAYGKQNREAGELVWRIDIPKLKAGEQFRAYKISKRFDQDISAVMAAFRFTLKDRVITSARIVFGGMAATPKRAPGAEAAVAGVPLDDPARWGEAIAAIAGDYQPISDMRASAAYRVTVAQNLLRKALLEMAARDADTRVIPRPLETA